MTILSRLNTLLHPAQVTHGRMAVALIAALAADGLQIFLQAIPLAPQVIDVVASVVVIIVIGFHLLLLPTFIIELVPLVDDLPTWTVCVVAVIALRRREARVGSADSSSGSTTASSPPVPPS
ncbi:MAG: hypothetical protein HW416_3579 [Chloroflexi bacterium]|nr:hypothetical protein [Chloroflexota bacterium]